jgi:hypothetical protein
MNNTKKRARSPAAVRQESKPSPLSIANTAPLLVCETSRALLTSDLEGICPKEYIFQPLSAFTRLSVFVGEKNDQVYDFLSCPWDNKSFFQSDVFIYGLPVRPTKLEKHERMICVQRSLGLYNILRAKINDNNEVVIPAIENVFRPVLIDLRALYNDIGHILARRVTAPVLVERIMWFVIPANCYWPHWVDDPSPAIHQWCGHYASQYEMAKYYLRLNPKFLRMIVEEQGDDIIWALRGHGRHWKVFQWNDVLPELSDAREDTSKAKWKTWKTYFKKNEKEIMKIFKGFSSEIFDFIAREDVIRLKFRPFMSLARWECFKYMTEK